MTLSTDAKERKSIPLARGCLDYFPDALAGVAYLSAQGNKQHHPESEIHWDRSKSTDHADALIRHFLERGTIDTDGVRHSAKVAWRALALYQEELEREEGLAAPRNATPLPHWHKNWGKPGTMVPCDQYGNQHPMASETLREEFQRDDQGTGL